MVGHRIIEASAALVDSQPDYSTLGPEGSKTIWSNNVTWSNVAGAPASRPSSDYEVNRAARRNAGSRSGTLREYPRPAAKPPKKPPPPFPDYGDGAHSQAHPGKRLLGLRPGLPYDIGTGHRRWRECAIGYIVHGGGSL